MAFLIPAYGADYVWGLTPRQIYNFCLLDRLRKDRDLKAEATAARIAHHAKPEDYRKWLGRV